MACCLTAPSHYLNQCWLIISMVLWHSPKISIRKLHLEFTFVKLLPHLSGAQVSLCASHYFYLLAPGRQDCPLINGSSTYTTMIDIKIILTVPCHWNAFEITGPHGVLRITGPLSRSALGKPRMTGGFPSQRVSCVESVSMPWRYHDVSLYFDQNYY